MKPRDEARYWSKVDKDADGGCWEWRGVLNRDGYGSITIHKGEEAGS